jgi:NtrC-family two-component system sensor histidine kinase KinB
LRWGSDCSEKAPTIPAGSRNAELLDAVAEETGRLTRLVNDLLDLSRMESGRIEMTLAPLRAEQLLERVAAVFEPQTAEKAIALKTAGEAVTVSADGDKITWVLTNLISNALRYTPTGGSITLSAERRGEVAVLSVSDTGVGIPPEMQQRIFEKFYQIPGRPGGGAGLGLAISREIVRAHGGHMWVESPPGQGARFYFTLPIALAPAGVQHNQGGRTV